MKDAKRILKTLGDQQEILVQKKIHIKMIDKANHLKTLYIVFYFGPRLVTRMGSWIIKERQKSHVIYCYTSSLHLG